MSFDGDDRARTLPLSLSTLYLTLSHTLSSLSLPLSHTLSSLTPSLTHSLTHSPLSLSFLENVPDNNGDRNLESVVSSLLKK